MEAWRSASHSGHRTSAEDQKLGRTSSIGNAKTLRSKLQARRVTLNEAIEKENLFLQGSERLASISNDQKTRDQASLQKDFAESKIKTLQAELTKINSSLHAYQAESAQGVQVPIIPLAMKTTIELDMTESFKNIIRKHYHTDPEGFEDSIRKFNELRSSIQNVERSESGVQLLVQYYNQLMMVSKRFLHPKLRHLQNMPFIWYDAINGLPATQQSAVFERACTTFNLGALYSQLAAKVDRNAPEALDSAIALLEKAIGVFQYTKMKFSHSPMMDMSSEILSLLSDLMRAQAQEMVWEKEELQGLKEEGLNNFIDYSHKTKSVAECYRPIRELMDDDIIKDYIPDVWISLIKIKEAHYKALAHYYAAIIHRQLASLYRDGGELPEDLRTEIHFLYTDCPQEALTDHPKLHVGIMKSHINCALLSHEYAIKFCNLCRDLHHITCLSKMLSEAETRTKEVKEATDMLEGVTIIAPTIFSSDISFSAKVPEFNSKDVEDLFASLGPLPSFSGGKSWSPPRTVLLMRDKGTFGFSIRGSQPIIVTNVDHKSSAEKAGMKVKDWILAINGTDVKYKSHDEVVAMVKVCLEEVTLDITTPTLDEPLNT